MHAPTPSQRWEKCGVVTLLCYRLLQTLFRIVQRWQQTILDRCTCQGGSVEHCNAHMLGCEQPSGTADKEVAGPLIMLVLCVLRKACTFTTVFEHSTCTCTLSDSLQLADDPSKTATHLNHGQREFFKHVVSTAGPGQPLITHTTACRQRTLAIQSNGVALAVAESASPTFGPFQAVPRSLVGVRGEFVRGNCSVLECCVLPSTHQAAPERLLIDGSHTLSHNCTVCDCVMLCSWQPLQLTPMQRAV